METLSRTILHITTLAWQRTSTATVYYRRERTERRRSKRETVANVALNFNDAEYLLISLTLFIEGLLSVDQPLLQPRRWLICCFFDSIGPDGPIVSNLVGIQEILVHHVSEMRRGDLDWVCVAASVFKR